MLRCPDLVAVRPRGAGEPALDAREVAGEDQRLGDGVLGEDRLEPVVDGPVRDGRMRLLGPDPIPPAQPGTVGQLEDGGEVAEQRRPLVADRHVQEVAPGIEGGDRAGRGLPDESSVVPREAWADGDGSVERVGPAEQRVQREQPRGRVAHRQPEVRRPVAVLDHGPQLLGEEPQEPIGAAGGRVVGSDRPPERQELLGALRGRCGRLGVPDGSSSSILDPTQLGRSGTIRTSGSAFVQASSGRAMGSSTNCAISKPQHGSEGAPAYGSCQGSRYGGHWAASGAAPLPPPEGSSGRTRR